MLAYYVVSVLGLSLWRYLGIKTSKHFAAGISCIYAIVILIIGFIGYWFAKDFADQPKLIAVGSFIILFGFAFAAFLPYLVLELLWGFDISLGVENTNSSKMAILYIYTFVPIISYSMAAYLLFSHSLSREEHAKIKINLQS